MTRLRANPGPVSGRHWPLQAYFGLLVGVFCVIAVAIAIVVHVQATSDARTSGVREATAAAATAATQLGQDIGIVQSSVANLAANPKITTVLAHPAGCTLAFTQLGPKDRGHLDIVRADGTVVCSSRRLSKPRPSYGAAAWLAATHKGPVFLAPTRDSVTGALAILYAAPIAGGAIASFIDLDALGPELAALFASGRPIEFLVTSKDGRTVITRSIAPHTNVGRSIAGTSFASSSTAVERRDLDGKTRLYHEQAVPGLGWHFFAGEDKSAALAAAARLDRYQLSIIGAGLLLLLAAMVFTYRRVVSPIRSLSLAVRQRSTDDPSPVAVEGPEEVFELGVSIDEMIALLGRSEASYRLLFQHHAMPMWVVDAETLRFIAVNDALVHIYGYSKEELLGMTVDGIRPPEDRESLREHFRDPDRPSFERETWRHVKKDGTLIDVEITSNAIEFEDRPARLVIARDVTEQRRLEAQLLQSQKVEAIGLLAGGIAHDFNNMLTAILGHADRAQRSGDEAVMRSALDGIVSAGTSAARLTQQLLAFSRRQVLQPKVVDIRGTIVALETMLHRVLGDEVTLRTEIAEGLWPIVVDPAQVEQVVLNLAINGRDAMPDGGTLIIQAANVDVDETYAYTRPGLRPGPFVGLTVTDTGLGMDEETQSRIFEPFFTTKEHGSGLGLATTFGIVQQSDGHVSVYSEPGRGTTFRLLFPAAHELPDPVALPPAPPVTLEGSESVLLVEDDELVRELMAEMLESYGYRVAVASNPNEARQFASHSDASFDLIVSDVMLPGQSGPDLARELLDLHPNARCLFTSGYAYGHGLGPNVTFLGKPFTGAELAAKIRETLVAAPATA